MAKRLTATVSDELAQAAETLRKKNKYRSLSEYLAALIRYDAQTQREHHLTAEWAALSPAERDRLDVALLRQVESGKGVRGSWLEATIADIVKQHLAETGVAPTKKEVARNLAAQFPPAGGT